MKHLFPILLAVLLAIEANAQSPDSHGEVILDTPVYRGKTADVPIPPEFHIRNEGGKPTQQDPQGAGLCVPSAAIIAGAYQGVADLGLLKESKLWKTAKQREGGYWPERWIELMDELYPGVPWYSWESPTTEQIEAFTSQGIPVCTTTNTGRLYNYEWIGHWIDTIHLDSEDAIVIDNNNPGKYHAMPRAEYDRRFPGYNPNIPRSQWKGWGFVFLPSERVDQWLLTFVCVVSGGFLIATTRPELSVEDL